MAVSTSQTKRLARTLPRPAVGQFPRSPIPAVNVAQVPQRSPLRYPGGKTWLIPHIRAWLTAEAPIPLLVEPFAGGGIVSLTAIMEGLAEHAHMVDLDHDVATFWRAVLDHNHELVERVLAFEPTRESIGALGADSIVGHAFRTLVLNRTRRGGILAPGASLTKNGENGKGVASRWYPDTLRTRLLAIHKHRERLAFYEGDGLRYLEALAGQKGAAFFIDPPYTAGGKRAGSRLYAHNVIDHAKLFDVLATYRPNFLMTYDCSDEVVDLVRSHHFCAVVVEMKNGHHARMREFVITRDPVFA